ncbi:hypothetical protein B0O80DRAFT_443296 [Mortierella sp. GBAus27b]|nr:hypothetical protein B0O80DRAFT_443296 [Mortierella sp. GBAus27b]
MTDTRATIHWTGAIKTVADAQVSAASIGCWRSSVSAAQSKVGGVKTLSNRARTTLQKGTTTANRMARFVTISLEKPATSE